MEEGWGQGQRIWGGAVEDMDGRLRNKGGESE